MLTFCRVLFYVIFKWDFWIVNRYLVIRKKSWGSSFAEKVGLSLDSTPFYFYRKWNELEYTLLHWYIFILTLDLFF